MPAELVLARMSRSGSQAVPTELVSALGKPSGAGANIAESQVGVHQPSRSLLPTTK
jgi:hypothetical protein